MIGPIKNAGQTPPDGFHLEIFSAIDFTETKAYEDSLARLVKMGYAPEEAAQLLGGEVPIQKANKNHDQLGRFATAASSDAGYQVAAGKLKAMGVTIASPGSSKDKGVSGAYYGSSVKIADTGPTHAAGLEALHSSLSDLKARHGLDLSKKGLVVLSRDPDKAGLGSAMAAVGGQALSIGNRLADKTAAREDWQAGKNYQTLNGHPWGVPESLAGDKFDHKEYAEGVLRHEIGHLITTKKSIAALRDWQKESGTTRKDMKTMVSGYGSSKAVEFLAESFALYTSKGYKKGRLPKAVEGIMDSMMKPHQTTKATKEASYLAATNAFDLADDEPDAAWFGGFGAMGI